MTAGSSATGPCTSEIASVTVRAAAAASPPPLRLDRCLRTQFRRSIGSPASISVRAVAILSSSVISRRRRHQHRGGAARQQNHQRPIGGGGITRDLERASPGRDAFHGRQRVPGIHRREPGRRRAAVDSRAGNQAGAHARGPRRRERAGHRPRGLARGDDAHGLRQAGYRLADGIGLECARDRARGIDCRARRREEWRRREPGVVRENRSVKLLGIGPAGEAGNCVELAQETGEQLLGIVLGAELFEL